MLAIIPSIHLNYWSKINKVIDLKPHCNKLNVNDEVEFERCHFYFRNQVSLYKFKHSQAFEKILTDTKKRGNWQRSLTFQKFILCFQHLHFCILFLPESMLQYNVVLMRTMSCNFHLNDDQHKCRLRVMLTTLNSRMEGNEVVICRMLERNKQCAVDGKVAAELQHYHHHSVQ